MTDSNTIKFKCQLSKSLSINSNPDQTYFNENNLKGQWYMSEKFDGIRAIWTGKKLITRALREFRWVPEWFIDLLPDNFPLDGEIYVPNEPFGYFSSLSIQTKSEIAEEKWKKVKYLIFDTPQENIYFDKRLELLKKQKFPDFVKLIKFEKIDIQKEFNLVNKMFNDLMKKDKEGVMLIKADSNYEFGKRSKFSLKYKKIESGEAKVIGLCEGTGKYKNFLGKLKCQLHNGKIFHCGTGFDDNQRKSYNFNENEVTITPFDENTICPRIGDIITYNCMEIIKKTNVPRMSVFKGIRVDLI